MDIGQLILAILAIVTPIAGGLGYVMKRYSDEKYNKSAGELEKVKADAAQSLSASESIKSLTGTLVTMVEERRESTTAVKDNTTALQTMSVSIDGLSKSRDDALIALTTAITGLTNFVTDGFASLVKAQNENTEILKTVAAGQDEFEDLYKALAVALEMVFNRLKTDNRKFAEYMLRPSDVSKQGIEDIATGKIEQLALPAAATTEVAAATLAVST